MAKFNVVWLEYYTGKQIDIECDLIDHDRYGDVRFYKYTHATNLTDIELVHKFEMHTGSILYVDFI